MASRDVAEGVIGRQGSQFLDHHLRQALDLAAREFGCGGLEPNKAIATDFLCLVNHHIPTAIDSPLASDRPKR
jgi:hypothetical protein